MLGDLPTKLLDPCRGHWQTDRKAFARLEECRITLGLDDYPLPIPVEDWIEAPLGIRFGFADLSYLGSEVLGAAFVDGPEILVDERVTEHEGRCRFTCAHELGHLTMHRKLRRQFHDVYTDVSFSADTIERQADRFAAAFLIPLPLLERAVVRQLEGRGLNTAKCVYTLMHRSVESEWLWRYAILPDVTKRFGVSLSAAIYRLGAVQPRITEPKPLLPRSLINRLLQPATAADDVQSVLVIDGVPQYRDLFINGDDRKSV